MVIMRRFVSSFVVPAAFGLMLAGCGDTAPDKGLGRGKPAPEITGEDQDGKPMKLSDFRGKVVLLDFWAGW
jgi:cytochrome oxidase Cu insertion factor (SCO1/SenC/PrrC family)